MTMQTSAARGSLSSFLMRVASIPSIGQLSNPNARNNNIKFSHGCRFDVREFRYFVKDLPGLGHWEPGFGGSFQTGAKEPGV
jgi:hypothetical protein